MSDDKVISDLTAEKLQEKKKTTIFPEYDQSDGLSSTPAAEWRWARRLDALDEIAAIGGVTLRRYVQLTPEDREWLELPEK